jgi:hypothetical protein
MNKLFKTLSIVAVLGLLAAVFSVTGVQAGSDATSLVNYLPYGLVTQDTMASVEEKLGQPKVEHAPQAGWQPGLPDYGFTPDYVHYWAVYERFGFTVIYNSPSPVDKNATIYKVILHEE